LTLGLYLGAIVVVLVLGVILRTFVLVPMRRCPRCTQKVPVTRSSCRNCQYRFE
jgi:hypothetical protein